MLSRTVRSSIAALCAFIIFLFANTAETITPVTPNASPEARALLDLLVRISGKYTLTGQHNYPNTGDKNSQFAASYIGRTPVVWSSDFGFAKDGDTDSYLARPDIVEEAKRQHRLGSIITICWHAVPPTADEPVTFRPARRGTPPESLASVQGRLLDRQFQDLLTPGTELHKHWLAQVDTIAYFLKQLQKAHVPVLWRPYHEMNGNWFWWGGRQGEYGTRVLYRQLFDRFVHHHKLNNLIWLWSVDRPATPERQFSLYFPGRDYLDVVSLDVYGNDFKQAYYDSLMVLADGKPLVLGEVGNPPEPEILDTQPDWALWVIWAGLVRATSRKQYESLINDPRVLYREDPAYRDVMNPYRKVCNLPSLPFEEKGFTDFSGTWIFNEEKSILGRRGAGSAPYKMKINQNGNRLIIQKTMIVEWGDNRVTTDTLSLDGSEHHGEMWNSPMITTAVWSVEGDTLNINSKVTFNWGDRPSEMVNKENWTLNENNKILSVDQFSRSFRGEDRTILIYDKVPAWKD